MKRGASRRGFVAIPLVVALTGACGGRTSEPGKGDEGIGGVTATGGVTGLGGTSTGATGNGGSGAASSAGSDGTCGPCLVNYDCKPGYILGSSPDSCCPVCVPACDSPCAPVKCAPGYTAQTIPGSCCPTCIADSDPCGVALQNYAQLRSTLITKTGIVRV